MKPFLRVGDDFIGSKEVHESEEFPGMMSGDGGNSLGYRVQEKQSLADFRRDNTFVVDFPRLERVTHEGHNSFVCGVNK